MSILSLVMSIAIQWIFVYEMAVDFRSANWGGAVGAGSSFLCCQFFFVYTFDLFNIFDLPVASSVFSALTAFHFKRKNLSDKNWQRRQTAILKHGNSIRLALNGDAASTMGTGSQRGVPYSSHRFYGLIRWKLGASELLKCLKKKCYWKKRDFKRLLISFN